jgi:hypothetical protein
MGIECEPPGEKVLVPQLFIYPITNYSITKFTH